MLVWSHLTKFAFYVPWRLKADLSKHATLQLRFHKIIKAIYVFYRCLHVIGMIYHTKISNFAKVIWSRMIGKVVICLFLGSGFYFFLKTSQNISLSLGNNIAFLKMLNVLQAIISFWKHNEYIDLLVCIPLVLLCRSVKLWFFHPQTTNIDIFTCSLYHEGFNTPDCIGTPWPSSTHLIRDIQYCLGLF